MNATRAAVGATDDGMVHIIGPEIEMHLTWIEALDLSAILEGLAMIAADAIGCSHEVIQHQLNDAAHRSESVIDDYMERGME